MSSRQRRGGGGDTFASTSRAAAGSRSSKDRQNSASVAVGSGNGKNEPALRSSKRTRSPAAARVGGSAADFGGGSPPLSPAQKQQSKFLCSLCGVMYFRSGVGKETLKITELNRASGEAALGMILEPGQLLCSAHFERGEGKVVKWKPEPGLLPSRAVSETSRGANRASPRNMSEIRAKQQVRDPKAWAALQRSWEAQISLQQELEKSRAEEQATLLEYKREIDERAKLLKRQVELEAALREHVADRGGQLAFSISRWADWDNCSPAEQKTFRRLTNLENYDALKRWIPCVEHLRKKKFSAEDLIGLVLVRMNTSLSYFKLAGFYAVHQDTIRRNFTEVLDLMAGRAKEYLQRESTDVTEWNKNTPTDYVDAAAKALQLDPEKIVIILADGTYHHCSAFTSFLLQYQTYSGQKKGNLVKSHQYSNAGGTRGFWTLGGGDDDDRGLLKTDLANEDSQLRQLIDKAVGQGYTPVVTLDGGYWEEEAAAVTAVDAVPWVKKNEKDVRFSREEALAQYHQMVTRSAVERWNRLSVKGFDILQKKLAFYELFRLEDMLAISVAIHMQKKRPLSRPEGALTSHQFSEVSDATLEALEKKANANARRHRGQSADAFEQVLKKDVQSVLQRCVSSGASASASADDVKSIFSREKLVEFFSAGRVERGHNYESLNWVFNVGVTRRTERQGGTVYVTAKCHHSRVSGAAVSVLLVLPKDCTSLADVSGRCSCHMGLSGQCGHLLALCICLFHKAFPEDYAAAFGKNRDGRNRPTSETLEEFLNHTTKTAKTKRTQDCFSATPVVWSPFILELKLPPVEKVKKTFSQTENAKKHSRKRKDMKAAEKEKRKASKRAQKRRKKG